MLNRRKFLKTGAAAIPLAAAIDALQPSTIAKEKKSDSFLFANLGGLVPFAVPTVTDYEVAAITAG